MEQREKFTDFKGFDQFAFGIHHDLGLCINMPNTNSELITLINEHGINIVEPHELQVLNQFDRDLIRLMNRENYDFSSFLFEHRERIKEDIINWLDNNDNDEDNPTAKEISGLELFLGTIDLDQLAERHFPGYQVPEAHFEAKAPAFINTVQPGTLVDTPDGLGIVYDFDTADKKEIISVMVFSFLRTLDSIRNYTRDQITEPTKAQFAAYEELI